MTHLRVARSAEGVALSLEAAAVPAVDGTIVVAESTVGPLTLPPILAGFGRRDGLRSNSTLRGRRRLQAARRGGKNIRTVLLYSTK